MTNDEAILHPSWQVEMVRNESGSYDVGLRLADRSYQMTWAEATVLSTALHVAVQSATVTEAKGNEHT